MTTAALLMLFATVSTQLKLPPGLLAAVCKVESNYDVKAVNLDDGGGSSLGVCQIKLATARTLGFKGSESALKTPRVNAHYAGLYLRRQLSRYMGNVNQALSAYNAGTCRLNSKGLIRNVRYVKKVRKAWKK